MKAPFEIQKEIERLVREMNRFGTLHEKSSDLAIDAQDAWEILYDDFMEGLVEEYEEKNRALPGEDVRLSLCRKSSSEAREAWRTLKRVERHVKKSETQLVRIGKQLYALQADLKTATTESFVS